MANLKNQTELSLNQTRLLVVLDDDLFLQLIILRNSGR